MDKLSRSLRGRIGESLKSVNAAPSLAQVTTASFEALRKYTAADRAEIIEGNRALAIRLLQETVAIDSTFAEAWRKLGIILTNAGRPRAAIDSALEAAYRHRHRTSPMERAFIEATYFSSRGANRDRAKGVAAYEEMLRLGDSTRAANNLALRLVTRREFARAETLYRTALRRDPGLARLTVPNLYGALVSQNKVAAAESILAEWRSRFPENQALRRGPVNLLYTKGDLAGYRRAVDSAIAAGDTLDDRWAKQRKGDVALLDGRFREFHKTWNELFPINPKDPGQVLRSYLNIPYQFRFEFFDATERSRLIRELEAAVAAAQASGEANLPYLDLAGAYSRMDRPDRARIWLARYDAEVKDTVQRRLNLPGHQRTEASVLLAEGKFLESAALYRQADRLPDGPNGGCMTCLPTNLAFVFAEAAMPDSAIFYAQQALTIYDPNRISDYRDQFLLPLFNRLLGELYEKKGDRVKAVEHYRTLIEQWKNADPELQVIVEDLKRRVKRLSDIEGTSR